MNIEYDNGINWPEKSAPDPAVTAGDDFRRRLAERQALGLVVTPATQEEWDEALAKFRASLACDV